MAMATPFSPETGGSESHHLIFGDAQEFAYETCIEHLSPQGFIKEATVFFVDRSDGETYALTILQDAQAEQIKLDPEAKTASYCYIDPQSVLSIMNLDSETLRQLAERVPQEPEDLPI